MRYRKRGSENSPATTDHFVTVHEFNTEYNYISFEKPFKVQTISLWWLGQQARLHHPLIWKKKKTLTRKPLKQPKKPSGCITGTLMLTLDTYIYLQHQSLKRLSRGETELNNKKQLFYNKDFLLRVAVPNSFNMFLLGYAYFVFGEVLMSAEKKKHASHVCYILQTRVGMYFAAEGRGFCYFACLHYHSEF